MEVQLICDTREQHVNRYLKHQSFVTTKQITHGDFNILVNGRLVATIERKTVTDYAASIKDGRTGNKTKLLYLRQQTGCQIYYIVEGHLASRPNPNAEFNGVKWSSIEHSMMHLKTEHYILVERTYTTEDSARFLIELTMSFCRRESFPVNLGLAIGNDTFELPSVATPTGSQPVVTQESVALAFETSTNLNQSVIGGDIQLLTARKDKSRHEQIIDIWKSVPNIGLQSAMDLSCKPIHIILSSDSSHLLNNSNKQFSKTVQESLNRLKDPTVNDYQKKFVSGFPGVGLKKATELLIKFQSLSNLMLAIKTDNNIISTIPGYGAKTSQLLVDLIFK